MFSWLSSQFSWLKISLVFFSHGKGGSPPGGSRQRRRAARALAGGGAGASGPGPWGPGFAAPTRRMWVTWRPDGIWWQCNIWNQAIMLNINPISPNLRFFPDFTILSPDLTKFIFFPRFNQIYFFPRVNQFFQMFFSDFTTFKMFFYVLFFQISPIWRCFFSRCNHM
jgi:hypothetical protein